MARKYILALLAASILVIGAYMVNTSGQHGPAQQSRMLPKIDDFRLR